MKGIDIGTFVSRLEGREDGYERQVKAARAALSVGDRDRAIVILSGLPGRIQTLGCVVIEGGAEKPNLERLPEFLEEKSVAEAKARIAAKEPKKDAESKKDPEPKKPPHDEKGAAKEPKKDGAK